MYVCICNNINCKKIDKALNAGISESKKVYSYFNCKPKCGKCVQFMNDLIKEKKQSQYKPRFEKVDVAS